MTTAPAAPRSLLSATVRFGIAAAVAVATAAVSLGAMESSHHAVQAAGARLAERTQHVTLPRVDIVVRRDAVARGI